MFSSGTITKDLNYPPLVTHGLMRTATLFVQFVFSAFHNLTRI